MKRKPFLPILPSVRQNAENVGELLVSDHEHVTASQDFNNDLRHYAENRLYRMATTAEEIDELNNWSGILSRFCDPIDEDEDEGLLHNPEVDHWLELVSRTIEGALSRDPTGEEVPFLHAVQFSTAVTGRFRFLTGVGKIPFRSFRRFLEDIAEGKFQVFLSDVTGAEFEYFAYQSEQGYEFFGPLVFTDGADFGDSIDVMDFMRQYAYRGIDSN